MVGEKKVWSYLLKFLGTLVFIVLLGLLAASLILAKPQKDKAEDPQAGPARESTPAVSIEREIDLPQLIGGFPAPVMSFMSGSGMTFVSAVSSDVAVDGGFGRIATLFWQTPEGEPVTLQSIWPGTALQLLDKGFHFMASSGPTLFGNLSVRMENDQSVRIHVTKDQALYVVLLPRSLSTQVNTLCRSLQLFTARTQE